MLCGPRVGDTVGSTRGVKDQTAYCVIVRLRCEVQMA